MPPYLTAKDLILQVIGEIGVAGGTYKAMEFTGDAISQMSMEVRRKGEVLLNFFFFFLFSDDDKKPHFFFFFFFSSSHHPTTTNQERMTVCNMVVEAGAKNGTCPCDQVTIDYVTARTSKPFYPVEADGGASYLKEYRFDVSKLEPLVAAPHSPDNRKTAVSCKGTKIDRVYIGSCTGGKTEDFLYAAKLFAASGDQQVKVPTYLVPATQKVWADVYAMPVPGDPKGRTAAEIFAAVGCVPPAAPSCAACLGGPRDTFARMNEPEICVSTTNRNFPGRMGHKDGQIYLASPLTAAASALKGEVADPRDFL